MTDSRFTTRVKSIDELLGVVDVDDVGDIGLVLQALYGTSGVEVVVSDSVPGDTFEVIAWQGENGIGTELTFPITMLEIARSCAPDVDGLDDDSDADGDRDAEALDIVVMSELELIAALTRALGMVRLVNLMDEHE